MHGHILPLNLLLCAIQAVSSFIHLEPNNATVLRGSVVHFNCSTDETWDLMTWLVDGRTVLSITMQQGTVGRDPAVSTVNHSTSELSVWELVLMSVPFRSTVQEVICELLPTKPSRSSATLSVQVPPRTTQDYTVLIAVTVAVCVIILLVILILLLYYRKKLTKSSSENKLSSSLWTVNLNGERTCATEETRGKVNQGYHAEDIRGSGHSELRDRVQSTMNISPPQVPDIVIFSSQNHNEGDFLNLYSKETKTFHQVTTV
ncbi:uncharacterized protein igsf5b isoform X2 [Myxocyprinus asiaticus]|uniref:uncharacterized protein igsf5b isoform X2 n=1 Tax=Myxocyprinus asiaticus TaxID=70543 RepID=UPI002222E223|nr:uncharacterized protein igsf5b isoform X2 [Myxocyprinus asiaticus]